MGKSTGERKVSNNCSITEALPGPARDPGTGPRGVLDVMQSPS